MNYVTNLGRKISSGNPPQVLHSSLGTSFKEAHETQTWTKDLKEIEQKQNAPGSL